MNRLNEIDATIEHMFDAGVDRLMMKAFCYRVYGDMTPKEVGRDLRISRIKVNLLIQTIPHKRLANGSFDIAYKLTIDSLDRLKRAEKRKAHAKELQRVVTRYQLTSKKYLESLRE